MLNIKSVLFIYDQSDNYYIDQVATFFRYLGIMVDKVTLDFFHLDTVKGNYNYVFSLVSLSKEFRESFTTNNFYYINDLDFSKEMSESLKRICNIIFEDYDLTDLIDIYLKNDYYIENQILENTNFFIRDNVKKIKIKRVDMVNQLQQISKNYTNNDIEPYLMYFINSVKIDVNYISKIDGYLTWYYSDDIVQDIFKYIKNYPSFNRLMARICLIDGSYRPAFKEYVKASFNLEKAPYSTYLMLEKLLINDTSCNEEEIIDFFNTTEEAFKISNYFYQIRLLYIVIISRFSSKDKVIFQLDVMVKTLLSIGEISSLNLEELKFLFTSLRMLCDILKDEQEIITNRRNYINECQINNLLLSELRNNYKENGYYVAAIKSLNEAICGNWPENVDEFKKNVKL